MDERHIQVTEEDSQQGSNQNFNLNTQSAEANDTYPDASVTETLQNQFYKNNDKQGQYQSMMTDQKMFNSFEKTSISTVMNPEANMAKQTRRVFNGNSTMSMEQLDYQTIRPSQLIASVKMGHVLPLFPARHNARSLSKNFHD